MLQDILRFFFPNSTSPRYITSLLVLYSLLSACILASRRINARLEASGPAPRLLPQMAQALLAEKNPTKKRRGLAGLLLKIHLLIYDKLKLLPDARTGRRLNYVLMLLASWLAANSFPWIATSKIALSFYTLRQGIEATQPVLGLQLAFFLEPLYIMLVLLPLFLIRKNREFYFDLTALFVLLSFTISKLAFCWVGGCCFGIPWPGGVYNGRLDTTVFPVQLLEVALGILIGVSCILFMLYAKSYRPGRGCSFCMFFFLVTRFFVEYLRYRGEEYRSEEINGLIPGLTLGQSVCVAGVLVAIAWLFILPLEKKLMDRLWIFIMRHLRRLAVKAYFHPRLHPFLSKRLAWCHSISSLEEAID